MGCQTQIEKGPPKDHPSQVWFKKSLKIPKGYSESVYLRTDNTMVQRFQSRRFKCEQFMTYNRHKVMGKFHMTFGQMS